MVTAATTGAGDEFQVSVDPESPLAELVNPPELMAERYAKKQIIIFGLPRKKLLSQNLNDVIAALLHSRDAYFRYRRMSYIAGENSEAFHRIRRWSRKKRTKLRVNHSLRMREESILLMLLRRRRGGQNMLADEAFVRQLCGVWNNPGVSKGNSDARTKSDKGGPFLRFANGWLETIDPARKSDPIKFTAAQEYIIHWKAYGKGSRPQA